MVTIISLAFSQETGMGVQTHFGQFRRADMDSSSVEAQLDLCANAGIKMIRDECLWSDVELDSGIYTIPEAVDSYVRSALSKDMDVFLILNYNNTLYAASNGSGVTTEANRIAYAKYCQAVVTHFYPLGVEHYEIWNEPNHGVLFWTPQPNANDYTALLHTAYDSIKAVAPDAKVIGCATSPAIGNPPPYIEGLDFIRDVFAAGGGNYMDAVSFHLYQIAYRPENELTSYYNSLKTYIADKPIYLSEFGYPTHSAWPNISLEKQASYITRMFLKISTLSQFKTACYYDLKNDGTIAEEPEHNFGLLQFDLAPKPAYTALKVLHQMTCSVQPIHHVYANGVYTLAYPNDLNILWSYSGTNTVYHIHNCEIQSTMPKYFCVLDMYGDTLAYHITQSDSIQIEVPENPIYCIAQDIEPRIANFNLNEEIFLLYPNDEITITYNAFDTMGIPIMIDPSAITWSYTENNAELLQEHFTAINSGTGMIIAEIQGLKDTINIHILDDPGYYTVEDFSDTMGFRLESTQLQFPASNFVSDGRVLTLNYEFNESSAALYLYKNMMINHHADSIYLDLKTDDKELEFRLYCKDANGVSYTLGLKPKPTDWTNDWGTLSGAMTIASTATAPIVLEKIYMKIKPGTSSQTIPYKGEILFDHIRLKKGDALEISETGNIPDQIILAQNYPNPFNGISRIPFQLARDSHVRVDILDLKGTIISTPLDKDLHSGEHTIDLDMHNMASGIYIYRLSTGSENASRKFVYIK
jgi:hypothetical protein